VFVVALTAIVAITAVREEALLDLTKTTSDLERVTPAKS
jgi:hypothetical protein